MRPLPWSHSTLSGFMTCARQYEEIKVLRNFQDKKNDASVWGDEVHQAFEKYLTDRTPLPSGMSQYQDYIDGYFALPGTLLPEQEYGLNAQLQPTGFLADDVWCRGIIDVLVLNGKTAIVADHKTGKNRKKDMQQLIIFALLTFYHHPQVQVCNTRFCWLQHDPSGRAFDAEIFTRDQIPYLWGTLVPKLRLYKQAFDVGVFPPKPSGLCKRHCAVETCEYHGGGR